MTEEDTYNNLVQELIKLQIATNKTLDNLQKLRETVGLPENQIRKEGNHEDICDSFLCQHEDDVI